MKLLSHADLAFDELLKELARPTASLTPYRKEVRPLIEQVRREGDSALFRLTRRFDGIELTRIRVPRTHIESASADLSQDCISSLRQAASNIRRFHRETASLPSPVIEVRPGVRCQKLIRPLKSVGLYVPSGSAPLVSTLLMLAIPAQLAGVVRIAVCTPPGPDAQPHPAILAACHLLGIGEVYSVGGAQAIAALAYGTESIAPVYKITGPGNAYVMAAKAVVASDPQGATIDFLAGPSELMILADASASALFVAADLLSQAEHDPLSRVVLLSTSRELIASVRKSINRQLKALPRREIAKHALDSSSLVWVEDLQQAVELANAWAPEHLSIQIREPEALIEQVDCAGSVFLGPYAPETVGDYCSGVNHVLPTGGAARTRGGVSVATFQKTMTVQCLTSEGLAGLRKTATTLARLEGLEAHARAVEVRFEEGP